MSLRPAPRERFCFVPTAVNMGDPPGPFPAPLRNTRPHVHVSPRTPSGLLTASLALTVITYQYDVNNIAVAAAPGLTLNIWRLISTVGDWAKLTSLTGIAFKDQLVLPDIGGGWGLYFTVTNLVPPVGFPNGFPGYALVGIAELP